MWAIPLPPLTLSHAPTWAGWVAISVGLVVLLGWVLDVELLKSMIPDVLSMKANTAVCFVSMGVGLVIRSRATADPAWRVIGVACLLATLAIALVTGAQYVLGRDLRVDQLLFQEAHGRVGTVVPGRMAPATILGFIALASAAIIGMRWRRWVIALCMGTLSVVIPEHP